MTRSYKKAPVHHVAVTNHDAIPKAKRALSRKLRKKLNQNDDPGSYAWHKKLCHSWQWHPGDGKTWDEERAKIGKKEWLDVKGK